MIGLRAFAYQIMAGRAMNTRLISAAVAALLLSACGTQPGPRQDPPLAGARIGGPFALTDQNGKAVTDRDFAGKYRIVYFGYTYCPDVCPVDVQVIGAGLKAFEAQDKARADRVVPMFVTIDPERDTPPVVKEFVANFHPRMVGLTGGVDAIKAAAKAYGIYFAKRAPTAEGGYLVDHSRQVYLMDPEGKPMALLPAEKGPQELAAELAKWVQ